MSSAPRRRRALLLAALAALVVACGGSPSGDAPSGDATAGGKEAAGDGGDAPATSAEPAAVAIPALGVDSRLVRLGTQADGSMEVPEDFGVAGWYIHGPQPGETGPAVIAGHVSSKSGPAVFHRLGELDAGDEVVVTRGDDEKVAFRVDRVEQHPKDAFPTDEVYGDTTEPELRLITCGGEFDRERRAHRDNVIVFATRV